MALLGIFVAAACSPSSSPIGLSSADRDQLISMDAGQEADLKVQTIGPGHYGDPVISSGSVVLLETSFPPVQNPGGPQQLYKFRAVAPGRANISIPHVGDTVGTPPFTFTVVVQ